MLASWDQNACCICCICSMQGMEQMQQMQQAFWSQLANIATGKKE